MENSSKNAKCFEKHQSFSLNHCFEKKICEVWVIYLICIRSYSWTFLGLNYAQGVKERNSKLCENYPCDQSSVYVSKTSRRIFCQESEVKKSKGSYFSCLGSVMKWRVLQGWLATLQEDSFHQPITLVILGNSFQGSSCVLRGGGGDMLLYVQRLHSHEHFKL